MIDACAYSMLATRRRASPAPTRSQAQLPGGLISAEPVIGTCLFGWLPHLARVLAPYPDVDIVVHSTWRNTHDNDELQMLLDRVSPRVLGSTPLGTRYESILEWLWQNPTFTDYRILDDETMEFPDPPPEELIVCNPRTGVSAPAVQALLHQWLRG